MPYINLIQEQRAVTRRNEIRARSGFFAFVGITSLAVLGYGALFLQTADLNSRESKLLFELQRLEPVKKQIDANKAIEADLHPRLTSLEEGQALTDRWVHILDHFTTQTPANTWITNLRSQSNDPQRPVALVVSGMSTGQEPVGEFMLRTQNEPNLEAVTLKYTNEKTTLAGPAIEFELGADVKGTAPVTTKEEDKKS